MTIQSTLDKINEAFTLESVTVHAAVYSMSANGISGVKIPCGIYAITDAPTWCPQTLNLFTMSPKIAHHLNATGKADIFFANGTMQSARNLKVEA